MNVSAPSPGSRVYVEISSLSAQIQSSNNVEDVHICGLCKRSFSDLDRFVEHKRTGCSTSPQKAISTSVAPPFSQSSLGYVTSTSNANDDVVPSLGTQYLQVILEDEQLNLPENQSQNQQLPNTINCSENTNQILRARLLGVAEQDSSVANDPNFQNSDDLHSLVLENRPQSISRREFQIDEEDVATLLANQLASEVVNSAKETSITSKTGNLRWTNGNEGISNKNNVHVSTSSSKSGNVNTNSSISKVGVSQDVSTENNVVVDSLTGRKMHKCTQESCNFTAWYLKDLVRHERKHTGERPFQCYSCHRKFSRIDKLHMHERIHTGDKRYQCKMCDYATHYNGSLRKHMRIHNDERPYKCQMCSYRSRDSSQLTVHLRTHTGDNPFVCTYENCTSAFKTNSDLKRHSRTHTGEKPFSCPYCQYKSANKSNINSHIRLAHSETKSLSCSTCNYVASTRREVREHEKTHAGEIFKCAVCSYTSVNAAGIKNHCKIHLQEKLFTCKLCSFTSQIPASLKSHMKKKHLETFRKKPVKTTNKECTEECKNATGSRSGGTRGSTYLKPFCVKQHKCTLCDAAFVREDSWRSHMRQHKNSSLNSLSAPSAMVVADIALQETPINEEDIVPDNTVTLEVHTELPNEKTIEVEENNLISTKYLILNSNTNMSKETDKLVSLENSSENAVITADSGIETSFVQFSVGEKNKKEEVPVIQQLTQGEVFDGDNLQSQPILLYVQNAPVLHSGLDSNLGSAEIVASINQSAPILVTGGCSQFLQLDQGGSLVEQFTSPLQQGMQYILSAPFEGVVGNTAYIQPLETTDTSGNSVSVVSFQVDKETVLTTQEGAT